MSFHRTRLSSLADPGSCALISYTPKCGGGFGLHILGNQLGTTEELKTAMDQTIRTPEAFVFADESEYRIPWPKETEARRVKYIYAVGMVVIEGRGLLDELHTELSDLRDEVAHDPSIRNHDERLRISKYGWHLTQDQISTALRLWTFMGQSTGIKYHYRYLESIEKIEGSKLSRVYAVLYASITRDICRRYSDNWKVNFAFEQLTDLNSKFQKLVEFCVNPMRQFRANPPIVHVVSKGESDLSSVVDYMILGISRLVGQNAIACLATPSCGGHCRESLFAKVGAFLGHVDSDSFNFRNFEYIRSSLSSVHKIRLHTGVLS